MKALRLLVVCAAVSFFSCGAVQPPVPSAPTTAPEPTLPPPTELPPDSPAFRNALDSTIVLLAASMDRGVCAGQFVSPRLLLTAYHCLDTATGFDPNKEPLEGKQVGFITHANWHPNAEMHASFGLVQRVSVRDDIALIQADEPSPVFVELGEEPYLGAEVFSIGHPDMDTFRVSAGRVTTLWLPLDGALYTGVFIYVDFGSSGGALYDQHWRLLGVTSMGVMPMMGLFTPVTFVRNLIGDSYDGPARNDSGTPAG